MEGVEDLLETFDVASKKRVLMQEQQLRHTRRHTMSSSAPLLLLPKNRLLYYEAKLKAATIRGNASDSRNGIMASRINGFVTLNSRWQESPESLTCKVDYKSFGCYIHRILTNIPLYTDLPTRGLINKVTTAVPDCSAFCHAVTWHIAVKRSNPICYTIPFH
jgi:hypothetical protein